MRGVVLCGIEPHNWCTLVNDMHQPLKREIFAKALGCSLRNLRGRKGLAQETLALHANVERAHMSQLERGLGNPTLETLFRLLGALDLNIVEWATEFENCRLHPRREQRR
jgi:DNA-binding XRE family transcriptional regulator